MTYLIATTEEPDLAPLSVSSAAILSVLYTLVYVLPFYLSAKTRPSSILSRDAPTVIRARVRAVFISCLVICSSTIYVSTQVAKLDPWKTLHLLGWWPIDLLDLAKSMTLVLLLFLGPFFEAAVIDGEWREWIKGKKIVSVLSTPIGMRNYIAGPLTEEIAFRSAILPLHILTNPPSTLAHLPASSAVTLIFLTPLYFGIAHIHHFYEFRLTNPGVPTFPHALLRSVLQFGYTSVFGWLASFLMLRTGSVWTAVLAHCFCNFMGLPRFWGKVTPGAGVASAVDEVPIGPAGLSDAASGQSNYGKGAKRKGSDHVSRYSDPGSQAQASDTSLPWTVVYYVLLVAGAVLFWMNLWSLTESRNALVAFGKGKQSET
ncbi:MAG: hypothetical protein M1831_001950 [Alyxoria varia]|nr:MAG: hypothetical protein M1831_001950 [Alyxoria varia]